MTETTLTRSDSLDQIAPALVALQAIVPPFARDSRNPFFNSRYASLPDIVSVVRPLLAEMGLALVQLPQDVGPGRVGLTTLLIHSSGQFIGATAATDIVVAEDDSGRRKGLSGAQATGSAITYLRRYALLAVVFGVADDDDDGNTAGDTVGRGTYRSPNKYQQQGGQRPGGNARPGGQRPNGRNYDDVPF